MKLVKVLKVLALVTVAFSMAACTGLGSDEVKSVDYSTTELTWDRLLDGNGTYVMDEAIRTIAIDGFWDVSGGLTSYAAPGTEMNIRFLRDANEESGYMFELTRTSQSDGLIHEVIAMASINSAKQLVLDFYPPINAVSDATTIQPAGESTTFTLDGTIEKDPSTGVVYLKFNGAVIHAPADLGAFGNEAFARR